MTRMINSFIIEGVLNDSPEVNVIEKEKIANVQFGIQHNGEHGFAPFYVEWEGPNAYEHYQRLEKGTHVRVGGWIGWTGSTYVVHVHSLEIKGE